MENMCNELLIAAIRVRVTLQVMLEDEPCTSHVTN